MENGVNVVVGVVVQELWNKVTIQAINLVSETCDMVVEKDNFQIFSRSISDLCIILEALNAKNVAEAVGTDSIKAALETLDSQLRQACKIIKDYKTGSCIRLLLHSQSVLLQIEKLGREIAKTVSSFQLVNLDIALNLKTKTDQIIKSLSSMELKSATATESIASEIQKSISHNSKNQENALKLLGKIAKAVGASADVSLVEQELQLLKQEKEEMEMQKKRADAFQLSQLIQLLYSTEIVVRPHNEEIAACHYQYPTASFMCPLYDKMMKDPVAILCGHSFERRAIQEHFQRGERNCPECGEKPPSMDLTPNLSLRRTIEEWKQRDMDLKFQAAIPGINSNNQSKQNKSLEDLQDLMQIPKYVAKVTEEGLIPKLVETLEQNKLNNTVVLKCLYYIAKHSDDHKEAIGEAGVIQRIVRQMCKGETKPDAIMILLELSEKESLGEKIGCTKDCIPLLVSLLYNSHADVSQKAQKVLQNLSSNVHFVVKMAEAGHFQPFVTHFTQGSQETRAHMAAALTKVQLKEINIKDLKDKQFIHNLVQMLSSSFPGCKAASLKCIKKLIEYPKIVKRLLADPATIPLLLGLIKFISSDELLKQEAAGVLALLVGASQCSDFESYQGLQELQSEHNINLFLHLVVKSDLKFKIQLLHLLVELSRKSKTARDLIRSNEDAVVYLFFSLQSDSAKVKEWVLKLLYCLSEGQAAGVPLPPSPGKEIAINTLATILTNSLDIEEMSIVAGLISQLPKDDIIIDDVLCKSGALKAIREVICSLDMEFIGNDGHSDQNTSLLENVLAALLRYTEPTKPDLQRQVGKLEVYPSLVRVLSRGSSLAKERTAIALAHLSQSTNLLVSEASQLEMHANNNIQLFHATQFISFMSWCCSAPSVQPLVRSLSETDSGVAEAALAALETLLADESTLSHATAAIVDNQGVRPILQVIEKGSLPAKAKALELFQKIHKNSGITGPLLQRSERILIQLLHEDGPLKKKAALVLKEMGKLPEQSSYF